MISKLLSIPRIVRIEGIKGISQRLNDKLFTNSFQQLQNDSYSKLFVELLKKAKSQRPFPHKKKPLISIITPVYNPYPQHLITAIESVLKQKYQNWELILVDDSSTDENIVKIINKYACKDHRIKGIFRDINGHICRASNDGLSIAKGDFIALLDHDDYLWPHALDEVVKIINLHPHVNFIYSDEDKIGEDGITHCDPFFKPDWSPHFLWSCNYITHFSVIRSSIIKKVNGFRVGTEGAQDWDLFLRIVEEIKGYQQHPWKEDCSIIHIPTILYSWRKSKQSTSSEKHGAHAKAYAYPNQLSSLIDAMKVNNGGMAFPTKYIGLYEAIPTNAIVDHKISIIIPTKNNFKLLSDCLTSIHLSAHSNYEIILIDTGSTDEVLNNTEILLNELFFNKHQLIQWKKPFNYSEICNYGAKQAKSDILVFLNDDTKVISKDWLTKMSNYAVRPEVGAVGARLLYPHGRIQHTGLIIGKESNKILDVQGFVSPFFSMASPLKNYGISTVLLDTIRDYSAVTGACLMIQKKKHNQIKGFDPKLAVAFNDVDYCLKLLELGLFNVVLPNVQLFHHESASLGRPGEIKRDLKLFAQEIIGMKKKWHKKIENDHFFNPNLTLNKGMPAIKSFFDK